MRFKIVIEAEIDIDKWIKILADDTVFKEVYTYEHEAIYEQPLKDSLPDQVTEE